MPQNGGTMSNAPDSPAKAINPVVSLDHENGVAVITVDSPPVNALSAQVREGVLEALREAIADEKAKAVLLICGARSLPEPISASSASRALAPPFPRSRPRWKTRPSR
jgi:hypothetical protein